MNKNLLLLSLIALGGSISAMQKLRQSEMEKLSTAELLEQWEACDKQHYAYRDRDKSTPEEMEKYLKCRDIACELLGCESMQKELAKKWEQ